MGRSGREEFQPAWVSAAVLTKHAAQLHSAGSVAPPNKGAGVGLPQFHHVHLLLVHVPAHGHEPAQLQPGPGLEHELEPEPELNQWLDLSLHVSLNLG
ncbi:unnamed protein product [Sphagnum balticum]